MGEVVKAAFEASGIDTRRFLKTDEEVQAEQQQRIQEQAQMQQNAVAAQTQGKIAENVANAATPAIMGQ